MKKSGFRQSIQILSTIVIVILVLSNLNAPLSAAAEEYPDNSRYSASLSPTVATFNTFRVTLKLSNLMDETPPSAKWYDPDGNSIGAGGSPVREYIRISGSLVETRDHFYISS